MIGFVGKVFVVLGAVMSYAALFGRFEQDGPRTDIRNGGSFFILLGFVMVLHQRVSELERAK